ncbi:hypothetical protein YYC_04807 [Plasmodium yoelii 17X]|uniref:YIR protein n=1 Tax=Plasmodium yoelii 17X TaxID=1323249 RepID=V7PCZ5_PLAYE|nr:hypothetical protein YYC_04807 [Plasmodium yoelii 17X]
MHQRMCGRFDHFRKHLPDESGKNAQFELNTLSSFNKYCSNEGSEGNTECNTELDKINAGCLWLIEQSIVNNINSLSKEEVNSFIIYIMIWLNYMLNLKKDGKINDINGFYTKYIENNTHYTKCNKGNKDCNITLNEKTGYKNFKENIDKRKDLLNINFEDISKFYNAFKSLCNLYSECNGSKPDCDKCSKYADEFVEQYNKLNKPYDVTEDCSYNQVLSTLSTDYDNFKKEYNNVQNCKSSPLPTIEKTQISVKSSEETPAPNSEDTAQSPSIGNKLFIVLSIFAAIPIFLGIAYKYSLFGFRKRTQKHHLKEKIKK